MRSVSSRRRLPLTNNRACQGTLGGADLDDEMDDDLDPLTDDEREPVESGALAEGGSEADPPDEIDALEPVPDDGAVIEDSGGPPGVDGEAQRGEDGLPSEVLVEALARKRRITALDASSVPGWLM